MDDMRKLEAKSLARAKSQSRRRRVAIIRGRTIRGSLALFVVLWGIVFVQLASGNDPALSGKARAGKSPAPTAASHEPTPAEPAREPAPEAEAELESSEPEFEEESPSEFEEFEAEPEAAFEPEEAAPEFEEPIVTASS